MNSLLNVQLNVPQKAISLTDKFCDLQEKHFKNVFKDHDLISSFEVVHGTINDLSISKRITCILDDLAEKHRKYSNLGYERAGEMLKNTLKSLERKLLDTEKRVIIQRFEQLQSNRSVETFKDKVFLEN